MLGLNVLLGDYHKVTIVIVLLNFQENYRMGGAYEWPPLADVVEYRRKVRDVVVNIIKDTPLQLPITMDSKWVSLI